MNEETVNIEGAICAPPLTHNEQIVMGHGAGGRMSHQLIQKAFVSAFQNTALNAGDDAALVEPGLRKKLSISTDSHVVFPLFFPGGDIGKLAVCGTVNDVAMLGAKPLYLTAGFILEEGLPMDTLKQVVESMRFIPGGVQKYRRMLSEDLIRTQTGIKEKFEASVKRSGRYLPIMEAIFVKEYGLPKELTRLPFVESSFDYTAYSSVGAAGIWQFMPRTGRLYMTINNLVDERRDPIESTRAAARYLGSAYTRIGTWPLAATSYNHGVGGIIKKVREVGTTDIVSILESHSKRVLGFASGNFFPELLAAIEVHENYAQYFPGLVLEKPLSIATVRLSQPLSISTITSRIGVSVEELKSVNYGISAIIWSGRSRIPAGYNLKVPSQYASKLSLLKQGEYVIQNQGTKAPSRDESGVSYSVRRGDTVASLARRFKITSDQLREDNALKGDALQVGQTLSIRSKPSAVVKSGGAFEKSGTAKKSSPKVENRRIYTVKSGDTLWSIGKKLGVKVESVRKANNLSSTKVTVGMKLKIPTK